MNFSSISKVIVQGITEPLGVAMTPLMQGAGTQILAGVSPGRGGEQVGGVPVYDLVEQVIDQGQSIDVSIICTHPYAVLDAALEAIAAGVRQIVVISQGIPPLDMVQLVRHAETTETLVLGPNSPGLIVPGQILLGLHPTQFYTPGRVGLVTRSGPLTYEIGYTLTQAGIGQSVALSIGADGIVGSTFAQWLQILDEDERTEAIVLVGEPGGDSEEAAAHYIAEAIDKPVVAYIAGQTAPRDRRLGHARAIIESRVAVFGPDLGTAESKIAAFKRVGIPVASRPVDIPKLIRQALRPTSRKTA
jgi:succinyl-CoA synthetase alpha subunit